MAEIIQKEYFWLSLSRSSIEEIIYLFRENLQQVEVTLNGFPVSPDQQLTYFDQTRQVKSFVVQGYEELKPHDASSNERVLHPIVLTMEETGVKLAFWHDPDQNIHRFSENVDKLLKKQQDTISRFFYGVAYVISIGGPLSVIYILQIYRVNRILELFLFLLSLLFLPVFWFLFTVSIHFLKLDRTIFLSIGKEHTSVALQIIRTCGILFLAIIFLLGFDIILFVFFRSMRII